MRGGHREEEEEEEDAEAYAAARAWEEAEELVQAKMMSMGGCEVCTAATVDQSYKTAFGVEVGGAGACHVQQVWPALPCSLQIGVATSCARGVPGVVPVPARCAEAARVQTSAGTTPWCVCT